MTYKEYLKLGHRDWLKRLEQLSLEQLLHLLPHDEWMLFKNSCCWAVYPEDNTEEQIDMPDVENHPNYQYQDTPLRVTLERFLDYLIFLDVREAETDTSSDPWCKVSMLEVELTMLEVGTREVV